MCRNISTGCTIAYILAYVLVLYSDYFASAQVWFRVTHVCTPYSVCVVAQFHWCADSHGSRLFARSSSVLLSVLGTFVLKRSEEVGGNTLNKDIRNVHAFLNWAAKNRFVASGLRIKKVKVPRKPVTSLSPQEVRDLLVATERYPTVRLRVLRAVTTGLRRGDIEAICIGDIHFDRDTIATRNRKAGKAMPERSVPEQVMTELSNYVATHPDGQERLFTDRFTSKKWNRVRERVRMPELKFHDLRKILASLLAQRGVSTSVTQRLLEHSIPQLTNDVYTNVDPVLREAISQFPVREWR